MRYDTIIKTDGDCALYVPCSLVQLARVVVCVRVLVDVLCVMIVVLIGRHTVGAVLVAIFVVVFCNWRCTLYTNCFAYSVTSVALARHSCSLFFLPESMRGHQYTSSFEITRCRGFQECLNFSHDRCLARKYVPTVGP